MTTVIGVASPPVSPAAWRLLIWRQPQWVWALLCLSAWTVLMTAGHEDLAQPAGRWLVMVTAMMLPPALPAIRHVALTSRWRRRHGNSALFAFGFLAVWTIVGAAAWPVTLLGGPSRWSVSAACLVAAAWEMTPAKKRYLRQCRSADVVAPDGLRATWGSIRFGVRRGLDSVGAGWAIMLPMVVAGHGRICLMAVLATIMAAEETRSDGFRLTRAACAALLGAAALIVSGF